MTGRGVVLPVGQSDSERRAAPPRPRGDRDGPIGPSSTRGPSLRAWAGAYGPYFVHAMTGVTVW